MGQSKVLFNAQTRMPPKMFYRKSELKRNTVKKGKDRPFLGEVFVSLLIYLDATRFVSPTVM